MRTDYSLRVLIYLLTHNRKCKIQEIADYFQISKNHLKVIVNQLVDLKIVESMPGPTGGISFNHKYEDIKLGDFIAKIEDLHLLDCFQDPQSCRISQKCHLKKILGKATQNFISELNEYTLKDLAL